MNDTSSSIDGHYQKPHIPQCARCKDPFAKYDRMARTGPDEYWHLTCFVCAHCFRPFDQKLEYYERFGRKYCKQDFLTLFAPCCARCHQHIASGRSIRAMGKSWHPKCFLCDECEIPLCDLGFVKHSDGPNQQVRALCHDCNTKFKTDSMNKHICFKCKAFIEDSEGPAFRYEGETYHAYHFHCHSCGIELKSDAHQVNSDLYCQRCHDTILDIPICGACRRPIEGERYVSAVGRRWHVEHFACAECERPFHGKRHFEVNGLAYCETDYQLLHGHRCYACNQLIDGDVVSALNRYYCQDHFCCRFCSKQMFPNKTRFFDINSDPCCKKCYKKFPAEYRKQLAKQKKREQREKKEQQC